MKLRSSLAGIGFLVLGSCLAWLKFRRTIPENIKPMQYFNKEKYLGIWYEIARFDYFFERNLTDTSAEYSLNKNGSIRVVNRGFDPKHNRLKEVVGEAEFAGPETAGSLLVSFFKPVYAGYNVIAVDEDYQHALVAGRNRKYLWLLSRKKSIPLPIKNKYMNIAESLGFDTSKLTWVQHNK